MTPTLSPPLNRALALAILLGLLGAAWYGGAQPLLDGYQTTEDTVDQLRLALARYERAGSDTEQRKAELAALQQRGAAQDGFLQGSNEALIAAEVQNRIKTLAESAKAELRSTQILPPQEEGKFRRISVRAQMSMKLKAAQQVFHGLEASSPVLFLDNVNLRARPERRREEVVDDPIIEIRFDVYGYTRGTK
jgi:general secretion pathway protein M